MKLPPDDVPAAFRDDVKWSAISNGSPPPIPHHAIVFISEAKVRLGHTPALKYRAVCTLSVASVGTQSGCTPANAT